MYCSTVRPSSRAAGEGSGPTAVVVFARHCSHISRKRTQTTSLAVRVRYLAVRGLAVLQSLLPRHSATLTELFLLGRPLHKELSCGEHTAEIPMQKTLKENMARLRNWGSRSRHPPRYLRTTPALTPRSHTSSRTGGPGIYSCSNHTPPLHIR